MFRASVFVVCAGALWMAGCKTTSSEQSEVKSEVSRPSQQTLADLERVVRDSQVRIKFVLRGVQSAQSAFASVPDGIKKAQDILSDMFPSRDFESHGITGIGFDGTGILLMGKDENALENAQNKLRTFGLLVRAGGDVTTNMVQYIRHTELKFKGAAAVRFDVRGILTPMASTLDSESADPSNAAVAGDRVQQLYAGSVGTTAITMLDTLVVTAKSEAALKSLRNRMKAFGRLVTVAGLDVFFYQQP
jgi:hypothetical protein